MAFDTYYRDVGRQFVQRAGLPVEDYEDHFDAIGRALFGAGGHSAAGRQAYESVDEHIAREEILPRLTDDLIAEHERTPIGRHSDDLHRVLQYFRRQPVEGKYVVVETERNERWCVGTVTERRGSIETTDECYDSPEAAEHAIFEKRVAEFRERFGEQAEGEPDASQEDEGTDASQEDEGTDASQEDEGTDASQEDEGPDAREEPDA